MELDENELLNLVLSNRDLQKKILDLNRIGQLYDKGIDSQGVSLKDIGGDHLTASGYAPFTISVKEAKGQRTDHITLRDTGAFYESFFIVLGAEEFYIEANPIKDDTNLFREWGEDILGLTDESKEQLIQWIKDAIIPKILDFLLAA